jgi:hypothetical protein
MGGNPLEGGDLEDKKVDGRTIVIHVLGNRLSNGK